MVIVYFFNITTSRGVRRRAYEVDEMDQVNEIVLLSSWQNDRICLGLQAAEHEIFGSAFLQTDPVVNNVINTALTEESAE